VQEAGAASGGTPVRRLPHGPRTVLRVSGRQGTLVRGGAGGEWQGVLMSIPEEDGPKYASSGRCHSGIVVMFSF